MKQDYRADIDCLRAFAVLAVVVFHFFPKVLPGGFVGVDVFFVISGFLITGIIDRELASRTFTIRKFYARRARRIFPALLVMLVSVLAAGQLFLLHAEFLPLLDSMVAGIAFVSNIFYWQTANYFDGEAVTKPLLHLWSLGVEEQFYLVWPLFLLLLPTARTSRMVLVGLAIAVSFAVNVYYTPRAPMAAFFLPFGRLWELGLGGLGAYLASSRLLSSRVRGLLSVIGSGCLLFSVFYLREDGFPGSKSIVPTTGALLFLLAGPAASINRYLPMARLPVQFGLVSYPLYLWHWPVLSFMAICFGEVSRTEKIVGMLVSVALAFATYWWVEKPLKGFRPGTSRLPLVLTSGLATVAGVCLLLRLIPVDENSWPARFVAHYQRYGTDNDLFKAQHYECNAFDLERNTVRSALPPQCTRTTPGAEHLLIWGDSHAQHLRYGIDRVVAGKGVDVLQVTTSGCAPTLEPGAGRSACDVSNTLALETIREKRPQTVVLAQRADHEAVDWKKMAVALKGMGVKTVILLGPVPEWKPFLYRTVALSYPNMPQYSSKGLVGAALDTDRVLSRLYSNSDELKFVSVVKLFCKQQVCLTFFDADRAGSDGFPELVTFDYGHLTLEASERVAERLIGPVLGAEHILH